MIDRINKIAQDISAVAINIDELSAQHISDHVKTLKVGYELENISCMHYLLYEAYNYNLYQSLSDLLKLGINVNTVLRTYNPDYLYRIEEKTTEPLYTPIPAKTLLGMACRDGNLEMVKYLIQIHSANINACDDKGNTPLHYTVYSDTVRAFENKQDQIAEYLLQNGANMFFKNFKEESAYEAANRPTPNICQRLFGYYEPAKYMYDGNTVRAIFQQAIINEKKNQKLNQFK